EPGVLRLVVDRLRELDVNVDVEVVAEEVREDRIHRESREVRHAEEVVADVRPPVRRVDYQYVILMPRERLPRALVSPSKRLPSALRLRLVLGRRLGVDEVRRVRGEETGDDG